MNEKILWRIMIGLILTFILLITWGYIDGEAALTVKTNEISDEASPYRGYMNDAARGPDNVLRHAYSTTSHGVNLSYSSDNGTTWTEVEILSGSYAGLTNSIVWGMVVSSNNTTSVIVTTVNADHAFDVYLITLWAFNHAWSWEKIPIHYHATLGWGDVDISINDTNVVLMVCRFSGNNAYKLFRMNDRYLSPATASNPTVWTGASTYPISCVANTTGKHWIIHQSWTGSAMRINMRDFCQTLTARTIDVTSWNGFLGGVVCLRNDVICAVFGANQAANYAIFFVYLIPGYTTLIQRTVYYGATVIGYSNIGLTFDAQNYVYISYYDDTNDDIKGYGYCAYNTENIEWASKAFTFSTAPDPSDSTTCFSGLTSLWPKVLNTNVGIPKTGFFTSWDWKDEIGAVDDYYKQVCWNNSNTWPFIFWTPPEIVNYSMIDWYVEEPYLHDFNVVYVWWVEWIDTPSGGWFLPDENGTVYGYCPDTAGDYEIRIWVEDFYGLKASRNVILTITVRDSGDGEPDDDGGWDWAVPDTDFNGTMWILLALSAFIATTYRLWVAWIRKVTR